MRIAASIGGRRALNCGRLANSLLRTNGMRPIKFMGDEIEVRQIQVINGGSTLQVNLWNVTQNHGIQFFAKPEDFLNAIGKSIAEARMKFEAEIAKKFG